MKTKTLFLLVPLLIATLACNISGSSRNPNTLPISATAPSITSTVASTFTPIPTLTPTQPPANVPPTPMLSQTVSMQSTPFGESGAAPVYTITAQIPNLQGSGDSRVADFNARLNQIVQNEITTFRNGILASAVNPPISAGSSLDIKYSVIGQRGDIWSVKFDISFYADGAAHPGLYSTTITYDLSNGREITLGELFIPNSNYLQAVSDYCKAQLSTRDIGFESNQQGADPLPENYQRWNISNDGLTITFDEYQVAAYAAGPQIVTIPFSALQSVISPNSAVGWFTQ